MYGVRERRTEVIKARQVEVSFIVDESNTDEVMNIDRLRKQGAIGFDGKRVDVKLTSYLTVHNVLAIESVDFKVATERRQQYLRGSKPEAAHIRFVFVIDGAKEANLHAENLIESGTSPIAVSSTRMKALRDESSDD